MLPALLPACLLLAALLPDHAPALQHGPALCPLAFQQLTSGCYFYGRFKLNWYRAMEFCHSLGDGASLAALETRGEGRAVGAWLGRHGDPSTGVWLGGSALGHPGLWSWFPTGELVQWADWGPGQPTGRDQHCLYTVAAWQRYQWADFHCDYQMTFLCEFKVNTRNVWQTVAGGKRERLGVSNNQSGHLSNLDNDASDVTVTLEEVTADNKGDNIEMDSNEITRSVIINKKEGTHTNAKPDDAEKEDEAEDWSILQMIKNIIKMPFKFNFLQK